MSAATKQDIERWFRQGKSKGYTHMIVVCDSFDWEDYPVYVQAGEDPHVIAAKYNGQNMQRIMEVYNLGMNMDEQLESNVRVFNY